MRFRHGLLIFILGLNSLHILSNDNETHEEMLLRFQQEAKKRNERYKNRGPKPQYVDKITHVRKNNNKVLSYFDYEGNEEHIQSADFDNYVFSKLAILKNPRSFKFSSKRLRNNEKLFSLAYKKNKNLLDYASERIQKILASKMQSKISYKTIGWIDKMESSISINCSISDNIMNQKYICLDPYCLNTTVIDSGTGNLLIPLSNNKNPFGEDNSYLEIMNKKQVMIRNIPDFYKDLFGRTFSRFEFYKRFEMALNIICDENTSDLSQNLISHIRKSSNKAGFDHVKETLINYEITPLSTTSISKYNKVNKDYDSCLHYEGEIWGNWFFAKKNYRSYCSLHEYTMTEIRRHDDLRQLFNEPDYYKINSSLISDVLANKKNQGELNKTNDVNFEELNNFQFFQYGKKSDFKENINHEKLLNLLKFYPAYYQYLPIELKKNEEITFIALRNTKALFKLIPSELKNNVTFIGKLNKVQDELNSNEQKKRLKKALKNPTSTKDIYKKSAYPLKLIEKNIYEKGYDPRYLPEEFLKYETIFNQIYGEKNLQISSIPESVFKRINKIKGYLLVNPYLYKYFPAKLKKNELYAEIYMNSIICTGEAFSELPVEFKSKIKFFGPCLVSDNEGTAKELPIEALEHQDVREFFIKYMKWKLIDVNNLQETIKGLKEYPALSYFINLDSLTIKDFSNAVKDEAIYLRNNSSQVLKHLIFLKKILEAKPYIVKEIPFNNKSKKVVLEILNNKNIEIMEKNLSNDYKNDFKIQAKVFSLNFSYRFVFDLKKINPDFENKISDKFPEYHKDFHQYAKGIGNLNYIADQFVKGNHLEFKRNDPVYQNQVLIKKLFIKNPFYSFPAQKGPFILTSKTVEELKEYSMHRNFFRVLENKQRSHSKKTDFEKDYKKIKRMLFEVEKTKAKYGTCALRIGSINSTHWNNVGNDLKTIKNKNECLRYAKKLFSSRFKCSEKSQQEDQSYAIGSQEVFWINLGFKERIYYKVCPIKIDLFGSTNKIESYGKKKLQTHYRFNSYSSRKNKNSFYYNYFLNKEHEVENKNLHHPRNATRCRFGFESKSGDIHYPYRPVHGNDLLACIKNMEFTFFRKNHFSQKKRFSENNFGNNMLNCGNKLPAGGNVIKRIMEIEKSNNKWIKKIEIDCLQNLNSAEKKSFKLGFSQKNRHCIFDPARLSYYYLNKKSYEKLADPFHEQYDIPHSKEECLAKAKKHLKKELGCIKLRTETNGAKYGVIFWNYLNFNKAWDVVPCN